MTQEYKLLIGALAQSVAGKPLEKPDEVDWVRFLKLCLSHAVTPLAYDGLKKADCLDIIPEAVRQMMAKQYHNAIFRDAQFDHLRSVLSAKLEEAGIQHIFLKGACLKHDYPIPALRTMSDMDVLVYAQDFSAIEKIAEKLEGCADHCDGNHRNYKFPGGVLVEFHPNLLHQDTPVGTQINPGWQYAKKDMPTSAGELTEEGFYLNTICHMANHFVAGGVGVRFVLDVWVSRHLRKQQPDRAQVEKELEDFGLLRFAGNIEQLAEAWFGQEEMTDALEELGLYILTSGSHGTYERAMLNAVALSPGGTRSSALLKKAFFSREEMEDRYTWCKGRPLLLPVAWCARAFRAVTKHGDFILKWSKGTGDISKEEAQKQKNQLARFGIEMEQ